MKTRLNLSVLAMGVATWVVCGTAQAGVIDINATVSGCSQCSGVSQVTPGTTITDLYSPVQVVLGAGTYSVTNAATTGMYSAWNFEGPVSSNWVWSFVAAIDTGGGTGTSLLDDYIGGTASYPNGVYATQALAAGATGISTYDDLTTLSGTSTAGFVDSFTLASTKTVDFFIDDYGLGDNAGGIALNVTCASGACASVTQSAVPEPGSIGLTLAGLTGFAMAIRRVRRRAAIA
jgi:hypothetical protein